MLPTSLSTRVILILFLPLVFWWGCLGGLFYLQLQDEKVVELSLRTKKVADALSQVKSDMCEMMVHLGTDQAVGVPVSAVTGSYMDPCMTDYAKLLRLISDDKTGFKAEIERSRDEARRGFDLVREIQKSAQLDPGDRDGRLGMWARVRVHLLTVLRTDFSKYSLWEGELQRNNPELQEGYRKLHVILLVVLFLATLAYSILSAIYLTGSITRRIALLNDNAYRLASDRPLNEMVSGKDEIAQLDKTFHRMAAALKEAEQLKQEVVVMVTHDLRTPLATLKNILKFLRSGSHGQLDEKGSEYVRIANRNVDRMSNLVNDLLDVEKVRSGLMTLDIQAFELADCFTAAEELSGALAEELGVVIDLQSTDLMVSADQDRVTRVLANLIANAVKFSPRGGTVHVSSRQQGEWVHTSVSDEGPGIPPDQLNQIFERFRQAESAEAKGKGGSGMGLTICKAIVELHGGKIWAENLGGTGSRFTFTLPAA